MSKIRELNDAINNINTDAYNDGYKKLGSKPVSVIKASIDHYDEKKKALEKEIIESKKEADSVSASISVADKKLADIQKVYNEAILLLKEQPLESTSTEFMSDLTQTQKQISLVRFNITTMQTKLSKLGNKIG